MADAPVAPLTRPAEKREGFVMIGCKAPNGLILNLDSYEKRGDQGQVRRIPGAATVTLRGWARKAAEPDLTEGGYMLTAVPVDFWREWVSRNEGSSFLTDKIILPPARDATGQAREHKSVPQMFRPAHPGDKSEDRYVAGVEVGERAT